MSYCVNCGVELAEGTGQCPLCDTPVINPREQGSSARPPFPTNIEIPKKADKRYMALITSFVMLLPNIVCVITNLIFTPDLLWSVYVVSTSMLIWFLTVFPFLLKKRRPSIILSVDALGTAGYIFVFYYYNSESRGWFLEIALPLVFITFLLIWLIISYMAKKRTIVSKAIFILSALTAYFLLICLTVSLSVISYVTVCITMILAVSSFLMLMFFILVSKNLRLRLWLSRKLFF